jgi:hypothetical protein
MKKSIKKGISYLFFLLAFNFLHAQNFEDVVYLKNGSIIRGTIIEQILNTSIKIQTKDRNVFVFKYDEIEKLTKENFTSNNSNNVFNSNDIKKSGFINLTELNYSPGIGTVSLGGYTLKNNDYSFGFRTVNGYQMNEHLSVGLGIGVDKYKNATLLPITIDARASFMKGKVSPVLTANIGYSVGVNDVKSGLVINPQIGIKTYISKNIAYLFSFGYKWQAQEVRRSYYYGEFQTVYYQFLTLSTGFSF